METSNWDGPVAEMRNQSSAPLERTCFPAPDESGDWTGPAGETNHVRVPYVSAQKKTLMWLKQCHFYTHDWEW